MFSISKNNFQTEVSLTQYSVV